MKATRYSVLTALFLAILAAPKTVRADSIVGVAISNVTFNTFNSCCGTQTLDAFFLWDNTSNSYIAGSLLVSTFGPLGSSFIVTPPQNGPSFGLNTAPSNPIFVSIFFGINSTSPNFLSPGTYSFTTSPLGNQPGTVFSYLACGNVACTTAGFLGIQDAAGVFLFRGAFPSAGSVSVFALSEPSSMLMLCTGLLGLVPLIRKRGRVCLRVV